MRWSQRLLISGLGLALLAQPAARLAAQPAVDWGLFNTGVDDQQKVLAENEPDPHYELIEPSVILGAPLATTSAGGFPVPPWLDDSYLSAWISPTADTNGPGDFEDVPNFVYRTTFDLTGVDINGLSIEGQWSSDNGGLDILVNGVSLGWVNTAQFGAFTPFTLDTGFVAGINSLDFLVNNAGTDPNPTGLRVEFEGNGGPKPPPIPPHPNAIPDFYATGVNDDREALEGDVVPDPHYTIVLDPNGDAMEAVTVPVDGFPIPPWYANDSNSRWISPPDVFDGNDANGFPGTYVYQTTFNMDGLDVNNAAIVVARGTDDGGSTVLLNGVEIPVANSRGFGARTWVAINSASVKEAGAEFLPGENSLAFVVENGGEAENPTGLRIDDVFARAAPEGTVPIPGLYNTGVDDDQLPLPDFEPEGHYIMTVFPDGAVEPAAALGGPAGSWVLNSGSSRWIGPDNTPAGDAPEGDYEYEIEFDLTGLDPASAVIMGLWSADNTGTDILLNGTPTDNPQGGSFPVLSPFEISAAAGDTFLPGVNRLTFLVNNAPASDNPTGLRVEGLVAFARVGIAGDYNSNGVLDAGDIDLLSMAVRDGDMDLRYDANGDGSVNNDDRTYWVNDIRKTYFGDANLDGVFSTDDFVLVFQAGEYEDGIMGNSTWATGDWTGDAEFDTDDFVLAFQEGGFELGPRQGVAAVPEPSTILLLLLGALPLIGRRRTLV